MVKAHAERTAKPKSSAKSTHTHTHTHTHTKTHILADTHMQTKADSHTSHRLTHSNTHTHTPSLFSTIKFDQFQYDQLKNKRKEEVDLSKRAKRHWKAAYAYAKFIYTFRKNRRLSKQVRLFSQSRWKRERETERQRERERDREPHIHIYIYIY